MIAAAVILLISVMTVRKSLPIFLILIKFLLEVLKDRFRVDGHVHHSYDIVLHHLQCFDKCSQSVL